jgi:hypothetical protein
MEPRVRIESDGTGHTSTVFVDGKALYGVTGVTWTCTAGEMAQATITLENVRVDLAAFDFETVFEDDAVEAVLS